MNIEQGPQNEIKNPSRLQRLGRKLGKFAVGFGNAFKAPEVKKPKYSLTTRLGIILGAASMSAVGANALISSADDCSPDLGNVCEPELTVPPIPPQDTVPDQPGPGDTVPTSPTMPNKPDGSTTTTTLPETTTTVADTTTTTVAETTTTTSTTIPSVETTTTTTTAPESTTTVVVTTAPPTLPPITVTIPTVPQHTK